MLKKMISILLLILAWPYLASAQALLSEAADDVEASEIERDVFGTLNDLKIQQNLLAPSNQKSELADESDLTIPAALQPEVPPAPASQAQENAKAESGNNSVEKNPPENNPESSDATQAAVAAPEFIFSSQSDEVTIHILKPAEPVPPTVPVAPAAETQPPVVPVSLVADKSEPAKTTEAETALAPKEFKVHLIPMKKVGRVNKSRKQEREPTNILDEVDE